MTATTGEAGQATIEWTGVVLIIALVLGALGASAIAADGRSLGGQLAHRIVCAAKGACHDGDRALVRAYGEDGAALVREHVPSLVYEPGEPQLPVDWRDCRRPACASAPEDRDLDVHRSIRGARATIFTRVLRRGGRTYVQYWFYYPDSNSTWAGSDRAWEIAWLLPGLRAIVGEPPAYPGFHEDDWESYFVRIEPDGGAYVRASSHGHWQGCKLAECRNEWTAESGWTRVSRGSHAGHLPMRFERRPGRRAAGPGGRFGGMHPVTMRGFPQIPGVDLRERTSTAEALRLIPLETPNRGDYRPLDREIRPPWRKEAYDDPETNSS
ncbi:MAG TPA: hypothetical protein VK307_02650 [Thermoleophilaceae bacterium]|nr:hypothetical protein [Thermoleophilaceae bacterium]